MSLLNIYKEQNKNLDWFEKYHSLGKNKRGKVFGYINTNFRTQSSFINHFKEFENVEDIDRKDWTIASYGQESDKHRVINMLSSKLFKKEKIDENGKKFLYSKTAKGQVYKKFINEIDKFSKEEKWLLNYVFLLNGHYSNTKNHIYEKIIFLIEWFASINLNYEKLLSLAEESLKSAELAELVKTDFFYLMSFHTELDFLEIYFNATSEEKEELYNYILSNLKSKNKNCVISKKYQLGGNYIFSQAFDEFKVFYQTMLLVNRKGSDINHVIEYLFKDKNNIQSFIQTENIYSIIRNIFLDFYDIKEEFTDAEIEKVLIKEDGPQEYIDDTLTGGRRKIKQIFAAKKKQSRDLHNHTCVLKKLNGCKQFTAKATNKKYVEIHHIIPQEFRNEFENSIEVFANYAALCPYCHSLIHKAVDGERAPSIRFLYNDRIDKLKNFNLDISENKLLEFYKADD